MKQKSRKARKAKAKLPDLDPSEWDFNGLTRSAVPLVCMREYAKECLQKITLEEPASDLITELDEKFPLQLVDRIKLMANVVAGLRKRVTATGTYPSERHVLKQVDLPYFERTRAQPTASPDIAGDFVIFRIDDRANTTALKEAFSQWLKLREKSNVPSPLWIQRALVLTLLSIHGSIELAPYDYSDARPAVTGLYDLYSECAHGSKVTVGSVTNALRLLAGEKTGRGDSKKSLLIDLAIYRLHHAGHSLQDIAAKLGKQRLKFVDSAVAKRAIGRASAHINRTIRDAVICEYYLEFYSEFQMRSNLEATPTKLKLE
jgi:hypothetical protein